MELVNKDMIAPAAQGLSWTHIQEVGYVLCMYFLLLAIRATRQPWVNGQDTKYIIV